MDDTFFKEELIGEQIEAPYVSMPVDPDNPAFNSLMGALKAVHEGKIGMEVLIKYYNELSKQLERSIKEIENMQVSEVTVETRDISLGSLRMLRATMDLINEYIKNPSKEAMSLCVVSLLDSIAATTYANKKLDENIRLAGIE